MRHVIVGASAAGMAAAEAIRKRDPAATIVMYTDEPYLPYYRPLIPYLIHAGKSASELVREPRLTPVGIELEHARVAALNPAQHELVVTQIGTTANPHRETYDRLLIATGASPIVPPITGLSGPGVFTLRTWDDAAAIAAAAQGAQQVVILGAGRIGMKAAFALRHLGLQVTVVEQLDRIVPLQLDATAAEIFGGVVQQAGITACLGHTLAGVHRDGTKVRSAVLDDGSELPAELLVMGVGVRPNLDLAQAGDLHTGRGLVVDDQLRTSAPDVYAAGDVVETRDTVTGQTFVSGIWTNAVNMGRVAGDNMAGGQSTYTGAFGLLNAMELGGLPVISVGDIQAVPGDGVDVFAERRGSNYRKLAFRGNRLVGLSMVGNVDRAGVYQSLIREQADVSGLRRELLGPRFHSGYFVHPQAATADRYVAAA